jgi:hypothetical protein
MIKQRFIQLLTVTALSAFFASCGTKPAPVVTPAPVVKPVVKKTYTPKASDIKGSKAQIALRILKHPKIILRRNQVSGRSDGASSYDSIRQVSQGHNAKRSSYGNAKGGYTPLDIRMLKGMLYLADVKGYKMNISSIAGGSHSSNSRHNSGLAFDVNYINGVKVNSSNPYYRKFMSTCRSLGATEVLGPGFKGHSGHVHVAWPR